MGGAGRPSRAQLGVGELLPACDARGSADDVRQSDLAYDEVARGTFRQFAILQADATTLTDAFGSASLQVGQTTQRDRNSQINHDLAPIVLAPARPPRQESSLDTRLVIGSSSGEMAHRRRVR